jgi:hypothetical protein
LSPFEEVEEKEALERSYVQGPGAFLFEEERWFAVRN